MHGGDSVFVRMTSGTQNMYRDSVLDPELDHKAHKVTEKLSESINTIANEPSVAFYRIQEHVRKNLPQLVELKHEVEEVQQNVQGSCFDTEYAGNAVKMMQKSTVHFQNIQELLKNAMFMKQQIDYEEARKRSRSPAGGVRQDAAPGGRSEDGSGNMGDSAVSSDSSLTASSHNNTEEVKDELITKEEIVNSPAQPVTLPTHEEVEGAAATISNEVSVSTLGPAASTSVQPETVETVDVKVDPRNVTATRSLVIPVLQSASKDRGVEDDVLSDLTVDDSPVKVFTESVDSPKAGR